MDEELKFITQREAELDERIRAIERTIHINSLCESIQDYKDQVKILPLRSKKRGDLRNSSVLLGITLL